MTRFARAVLSIFELLFFDSVTVLPHYAHASRRYRNVAVVVPFVNKMCVCDTITIIGKLYTNTHVSHEEGEEE